MTGNGETAVTPPDPTGGSRFDARAALHHVMICLATGAVVDYLTSFGWIAAALWTSAGMFAAGSLAYFADAQPGGFDNPDGSATSSWTSGLRALAYWGIATLLLAAGLLAHHHL